MKVKNNWKFLMLIPLILFMFTAGCSENGDDIFTKFLSKVVKSFSPAPQEVETTGKAGMVQLTTAAQEEEKETNLPSDTAETTEDSLEAVGEALHWSKYYYNDRGKSDPFRPLLTSEEKQEKMVNVDIAKLTGIIWGKKGYLALLKEGNRGYVLREGDRVIDGKVLEITKESVTFLLSRFGEQNTITMELKKEER